MYAHYSTMWNWYLDMVGCFNVFKSVSLLSLLYIYSTYGCYRSNYCYSLGSKHDFTNIFLITTFQWQMVNKLNNTLCIKRNFGLCYSWEEVVNFSFGDEPWSVCFTLVDVRQQPNHNWFYIMQLKALTQQPAGEGGSGPIDVLSKYATGVKRIPANAWPANVACSIRFNNPHIVCFKKLSFGTV